MLINDFFFNDTATTEIYTLSLHDALPIWRAAGRARSAVQDHGGVGGLGDAGAVDLRLGGELPDVAALPLLGEDRKSTRLNSSHANISYAVFCLKKKNHSIHFHIPHTFVSF